MRINKNDIGQGSGSRLLMIRNMLNLTKRQMAARLDTLPGTYYKNETGESRPGWKTLFILQHDYNISVDWLMFNKGHMYIKEKIALTGLQAELAEEKQMHAKVNQQLKEAQEALKDFHTLKKQLPDVEKMLEMMVNDPELRYDMLRNFHKYQKIAVDKKEL